jgi:chromate transporter
MSVLPASPPAANAAPRPQSLRDLFVTFTLLALQGFGGVLAVAQRVLCEHKRWLTREQFVELLAVGQVLPGPNVCNVALLVGDRFLGWRGALAALAGMMTVPLVIVLALTALYANFAAVPQVAGALKGMGAVAAGMIAGTAARLAGALAGSPLGVRACAALGVVVFTLIALLRLPLVWVLATVGTVAVLWARHAIVAVERRSAGAAARGLTGDR